MSTGARLALDGGLLVALLVAYTPSATGIPLHEWLCLALALATLVHLIVNWDWVVGFATRTFERARTASRLNLVVDALLFIGTVTVMLSGFMVSTTLAPLLGASASSNPAWHIIHSASADLTVLFFAVHTALHWRWIARAASGLLRSADRRLAKASRPAQELHATRSRGTVPVMSAISAAAPARPRQRSDHV